MLNSIPPSIFICYPAYMPDYELHHNVFDAVPHPDIKPMAYVQNSLMSGM